MALSLSPSHLKRYKDLAWLFLKYGRSEVLHAPSFDEAPPEVAAEVTKETASDADRLAADLEQMGPTFIKLGQLLSTRPDLLPPQYAKALARLQDKVEPVNFGEVEKIIAAELGVRVSRAFQSLEPVPMAAASLGQVHRAVLRDGRVVAVKVQRPGIREQVMQDLDSLGEVAGMLEKYTDAGRQAKFAETLEEFRRMLLRELDYRLEAQNLITLGRNLAGFRRIVVPQPVEDYSSSRVLTMEYVSGQKITGLSPVARLEIDGECLADELLHAYLQQILVDGFFHADPHPGNVFLTQDNRIALLDLGMAARIAPQLQEDLLQLVLAVSEGRSDDAVEFALKNGEKTGNFDEKALRRRVAELVARQQDASMARIEVGTMVLAIRKVALECGIRLPPELALIGKTLLNLDGIGRTLAPEFDPNAAIRRHAATLLRQRMFKGLAPGNLFSRMLELKDFAERLPQRINRIMDAVANNELQVKVHAIDETRLMTGLQKIANRITLGLILASLIVGAALLMRVQTNFTLFGYPGLAIIFFLLAAAGGCVLMFHILFHDESWKP